MAGIRVKQLDVIEVEVNDNGDTIQLREDMEFLNSLKLFGNFIKDAEQDFKSRMSNVDDKDINAKYEIALDIQKQLGCAVNMLFGDSACDKIFNNGKGNGRTIPRIDQVLDFFVQLTPYINKMKSSFDKGGVNNIKSMQGYKQKQETNKEVEFKSSDALDKFKQSLGYDEGRVQ